VVEQVVRLQDAVERHPPTEPEPLLEPQIDTVERIADKLFRGTMVPSGRSRSHP
jgi:hypothetical protein